MAKAKDSTAAAKDGEDNAKDDGSFIGQSGRRFYAFGHGRTVTVWRVPQGAHDKILSILEAEGTVVETEATEAS